MAAVQRCHTRHHPWLSNLSQSLPAYPRQVQPWPGQSARCWGLCRAMAAEQGEAAPSMRAATGASRQATMPATSRAVGTGRRLAASGTLALQATTTTRCVAGVHLATWALLCLAQQAATAGVSRAWCSQVALSVDRRQTEADGVGVSQENSPGLARWRDWHYLQSRPPSTIPPAPSLCHWPLQLCKHDSPTPLPSQLRRRGSRMKRLFQRHVQLCRAVRSWCLCCWCPC